MPGAAKFYPFLAAANLKLRLNLKQAAHIHIGTLLCQGTTAAPQAAAGAVARFSVCVSRNLDLDDLNTSPFGIADYSRPQSAAAPGLQARPFALKDVQLTVSVKVIVCCTVVEPEV